MRTLSKMTAISLGLFLALAISAFAQTSSPQTSAPDSQPQAAPPSQSTTQPPSQATPPNSPPTQQAPSTAPQTAPSTSNEGKAQEGQNKGLDIDQELQLSEDQKQKIAAVVDDENKQIASVRDDNSMTLQQKQQKVLQIRQTGTPKIKAILTPEQLQKLAALQQRMRDQQNAGQTASPSGTQSAPQTPPQH